MTFWVTFWSSPGFALASLKSGTPMRLIVGSTTVPLPTSA
jgi:hypothetical protein